MPAAPRATRRRSRQLPTESESCNFVEGYRSGLQRHRLRQHFFQRRLHRAVASTVSSNRASHRHATCRFVKVGFDRRDDRFHRRRIRVAVHIDSAGCLSRIPGNGDRRHSDGHVEGQRNCRRKCVRRNDSKFTIIPDITYSAGNSSAGPVVLEVVTM